jgi:predicted PurR-regulated permease PerM
MPRTNTSPSSSQFVPLIAFICSVAALYFAREVLIPIALAVLLSFLLTPVVAWLERLRFSRFPAVVVVLVLSLSAVGGVGWIVANQLLEVINQLPNYKDNIHRRLESIHGSKGGGINRATHSVEELSKELSTTPRNQAAAVPREPAPTTKAAAPFAGGLHPVPVEVVEPPPNALQSFRNVAGPLVRPLGTAIIVIVFSIFMLMRREDVRNRLIRLVARGRLNVITQALDDAGRRVSRYLLMQFLVNTILGTLIAIGLAWIGVPNALLWGTLAASLRFIPYLGPLVAGALPILLATAVFNGWTRPLLVLGLFLVMELITANLIEPWLYGTHTGISSLAILVAAVFWAVVWGPVGLILSTPLTVCLLVMGRHVPQFEFLHILLGDEPVLAPEAVFYQRLLALDQKEAQTIIDTFLKQNSLVHLYDEVIIPALAMAEQDRHQGALDENRETFIIQTINEFIAELADHPGEPPTNGRPPAPGMSIVGTPRAESRVVCLPANDQADEITAAMLAQLLEQAGYAALSFGVTDSPVDVLKETSLAANDVVCICALPPLALFSARNWRKRLRTHFPDLMIVVGLWNYSVEGGERVHERLENAFVGTVVTTLKQALEEIYQLTSPELSAAAIDVVKRPEDRGRILNP